MQLVKHISIRKRRAEYTQRDGFIICHNSDYTVSFTFDAEWNGVAEKYARFVWGGRYQDVKFTGTTCTVPAIRDASFVRVGVYTGDPDHLTADDFFTTVAAIIPCQASILDLADLEHQTSGGGGEQPTLYVPDIALDLRTKILTITDEKNGLFPSGYNIFKNGGLLGLVQKGAVALTDYTDYDGDATIAVRATGNRFNDSLAATAAWTRPKLYAPTIDINNITDTLTITDTNGADVSAFAIYANGELLATVNASSVVLSAYMELTETQEITVQALSGHAYYVDSDKSNKVLWFEKTAGTEGLAYELTSDDKSYICAGIGTATNMDIVIGSMHNGLPVISIERDAFRDTSITAVEVPDSVTSIDSYAFWGCEQLITARIGASVRYMGDAVFNYCSALSQVTFAEGIMLKIINPHMFQGCVNLPQLSIPDGVTMIRTGAFFHMKGLKEIIIPASVTAMSRDVFNDNDVYDDWAFDIYFGGTEAQWATLAAGAYGLTKATIHYNYTE